VQHAFLDQDGGRRIYFEGTYSASFSGNSETTPRYDYNQILYRLDLDDPRLALPSPIYRRMAADGTSQYLTREGVEQEKAWDRVEEIAFFAVPPSVKHQGLISVYADCGLHTRPPKDHKVVPGFFAAADAKAAGVVPLHEFRDSMHVLYSTCSKAPAPHWGRQEAPICYVWENPSANLTLDRGATPYP
jgi:hypothetical protein